MGGLKYVNSIIIDCEQLIIFGGGRHTIAHEIGHVLTDEPHFGGENPAMLNEQHKRNIMAIGEDGGRFTGFGMQSGKRFNQDSQTIKMLGHRACKNY